MSAQELEARADTWQHQYRSLFTMLGMGRCEMGIITVGHRTLHIHPVFTRRHCCKQSKTEGGRGLGMRLANLHKHVPVTDQCHNCKEKACSVNTFSTPDPLQLAWKIISMLHSHSHQTHLPEPSMSCVISKTTQATCGVQ